jgi:hypothetical protein
MLNLRAGSQQIRLLTTSRSSVRQTELSPVAHCRADVSVACRNFAYCAQADFVRGMHLAFAWLQPILLQHCQPWTTPKQAIRSILHSANLLLHPDRICPIAQLATFYANVFCAYDLATTRHRHRQLPPTQTITRSQFQCHAPSRISRISQQARSPADSALNTRSLGVSQSRHFASVKVPTCCVCW